MNRPLKLFVLSREFLSWCLVAIVFSWMFWGQSYSASSRAMAGLDVEQVRIGLLIFAVIAVLWLTELLPLAVTALLVPVLATGLGVSAMKDSLAGFADPLIFLFLGGFALAAALAAHGIDRWLVQGLIRLGRGHFLPCSIALFISAAVISMWISNTATCAMLLPLAMSIVWQLPTDRERQFILLGLAYSASIGGMGLLMGSAPNGIAAKQLGIGFQEWAKIGLPLVAILLPLMIGVMFFVLRPQRGFKITAPEEKFEWSLKKMATLGIFFLTVSSWALGGTLQDWLGISASFETWVALFSTALLFASRVLTWQDFERQTEWGVLLLFGGGIALGGVLKDSGASVFLARSMADFAAHWSPLAWLAVTLTGVIFMTELVSNTALTALFVPIIASIAAELGVAQAPMVIAVAIAASCAFALPVATPPNALVYASGLVAQSTMLRVGVILNLACVAVLAIWFAWFFGF
ncbi:MAG: SLC13/DASS family transporter [Verrucomicrobia bacterium]|nr:MAG: SLC13/DASS family transporter [Verrucomicrobiota bacterium]